MSKAPGAHGLASTGDNLASRYTTLADDGSQGGPKREAAIRFSMAESTLEESEDVEETTRIAKEALALFKSEKDLIGVADTVRLLCHAQRVRAESYLQRRLGLEGDPTAHEGALKAAEQLAQEELAAFQESKDIRGQGAMLLSLAEVHSAGRGAESGSSAMAEVDKALECLTDGDEKRLEALAYCLRSTLQHRRVEGLEAAASAEAALHIFRELQDVPGQARALHLLGQAHVLGQKFPDAIKNLKASLKMYREMGRRLQVGREQYHLAHCYLLGQRFTEALGAAHEAHQIFEELGYDRGYKAGSLSTMVSALVGRGEETKAIKVATEAVERYREANDQAGQATMGQALVVAHLGHNGDGDMQEATDAARTSLSRAEEAGNKAWECEALLVLSQLRLRAQEHGEAADCAERARSLALELMDESAESAALDIMAKVHAGAKDYDKALQAAAEHRELHVKSGERVREGMVVLWVCTMHCRKPNVSRADLLEAMEAAEEARQIFLEAGDKTGEAAALSSISEIHLAGGGDKDKEPDKALVAARQARVLFQEAGDLVKESMLMKTFAKIYLEKEEPHLALQAAQDAVALARKAQDQYRLAEMTVLLSQMTLASAAAQAESKGSKDPGRALLRGGRRALKYAKEALHLSKRLLDRGLILGGIFAVSEALAACGRPEECMRQAEAGMALAKEIADPFCESAAACVMAEALHTNGHTDKAIDEAERAYRIAELSGDGTGQQRAVQLLGQLQQLKDGGAQKEAPQAAPDAGRGRPAQQQQASAAAPTKPGLDEAVVHQTVMATVQGVMQMPDVDVHLDSPLMEVGLDSLSSVAFRNALNQQMRLNLPASLMFDYPSPRAIIDHIVQSSRE